MSSWDYERVRQLLEGVRSLEDAHEFFRSVHEFLPIRYASFRYWRAWSPGADCLLELSNYPQKRTTETQSLEGLRRANMDRLAFQHILPINYIEEINTGTELGQYLALRYQALTSQLGFQPVGFAIIIVSSAGDHALFVADCEYPIDEWTDHFNRVKGTIQLIAQEIFVVAARVVTAPRDVLAPREKECLHRASQGKTVKQIARELNLSDQTVTFYLGRIRMKLGVSNTTEAVAKAFKVGFLGKD